THTHTRRETTHSHMAAASSKLCLSLASLSKCTCSCAEAGDISAATSCLDELEARRIRPDTATFTPILAELSRIRDQRRITAIFHRMRQAGLAPDTSYPIAGSDFNSLRRPQREAEKKTGLFGWI
ncbi:unnamed protein product, partial [Effrenium voratum]